MSVAALRPKRPRILVDCRMALSSGVGTYIRNIIPLIQKQAPYEFFFLGKREELSAFPWCGPGRAAGFNTPLYSPLEHFVLYGLIRRMKPDLFWSPHYNAPLIGEVRRLTTIHDVFHISRENTEWGRLKKSYARSLLKAAMRRSARVLTDSAFTAEEMLRYGLPCADKARVVHLGVAPPESSSARLVPSHFLFVGNVKPHKNLKRLIEAYAKARRSGCAALPLKIVGETGRFLTGQKGLPELASSLGVASEIEFTGRVTDPELEALYSGAMALLFPSLYEGFGLPPLEAMARSVPALVSRAASLPEACGDAALYCDPMSVDDIAAQIVNISRDETLRLELVQKGLQRARKFTWEAAAQKTAEVIDEALSP